MPRAKSRPTSSASSKRSSARSNVTRYATRREEQEALRRYLDFVRAIVGSSRNGR